MNASVLRPAAVVTPPVPEAIPPIAYDPAVLPELLQALDGIDVITDLSRVERLSRDFAWFSPVLKRELEGKRADVVVRPRTEDEIVRVVSACARLGVPLTPRGSGTGNYGQCTPIHGGVLLDLSGYNQFMWCRHGVGRAQAGIRLADFDTQARPKGWELRWLPSTFRSATLGGLYGGGFGGLGSINYGPLAAPGNVLGLKAITIELEPRLIELRGADALLLHHVYGTNGLVLELEVALAPAHDWLETLVVFDHFDHALNAADSIARAPGIEKKGVTFLAAPVPAYMTALAEYLPSGCHALICIVAEHSEDGFNQLVSEAGGRISYRRTADEVASSKRTLMEFAWNHTTLHALKVDPGLTYIQTGFDPTCHLAQVRALREALGDEMLVHLEFIRTKEGAHNCSGLQMLHYSTDERLAQIMQIHRDHGVMIANPHVWRVEDGKQGRINREVVATKARLDPQGLLNPGKLRGWDERVALLAAAATAEEKQATLPRF
jgi:FAD/FMN-containing dehydrogenase